MFQQKIFAHCFEKQILTSLNVDVFMSMTLFQNTHMNYDQKISQMWNFELVSSREWEQISK